MSEQKREISYNKRSIGEYASWMETIGYTDPLLIIEKFLIENGLETEAISMVANLAKAALEKDRAFLQNARASIPVMPDIYYSNEGISYQTARFLVQMGQCYILSNEIPEALIKKARAVIPKMKTPYGVYMPMVEYLGQKYGIYFNDWYENSIDNEDK